jgi:hypothetical protein
MIARLHWICWRDLAGDPDDVNLPAFDISVKGLDGFLKCASLL